MAIFWIFWGKYYFEYLETWFWGKVELSGSNFIIWDCLSRIIIKHPDSLSSGLFAVITEGITSKVAYRLSHALEIFLLWLMRIEPISGPIYQRFICLFLSHGSISWPYTHVQSTQPRTQRESFHSSPIFFFFLITISSSLGYCALKIEATRAFSNSEICLLYSA